VLEAALREQFSRNGGHTVQSVLETERIVLAGVEPGRAG
jgi:hypothetical protein